MKGTSGRRFLALAVSALVGLCIVLGLAACGSSGGGPTAAATTAGGGGGGGGEGGAKEEGSAGLSGSVTIGAVLPLTGGLGPTGEAQLRGAELAVERVNGEGGVLGRKLQLQVEDSAGETVAAVEAAQKLVSVDHVPVVLGEFVSSNTIAIGKVLQRAHVVQVNSGSSSLEVAGIGDYSFSVIGLDSLSAKVAAEKILQGGYRKVAFMAPDNSYGINIDKAFRGYFEDGGGEVAASVLFQEGKSDYRAELGRMEDSGAELFVYSTYAPDSQTINKNAYELGIPATKWFGIYLSLQIEGLEPQIVAGQQGTDLSYVGRAGAEFTKAYEAKYGEVLTSPYSALAYDGIRVAAKAMEKAGSTEPAAVRQAMTKVGRDFPGASGSITFDHRNQRVEQEYDLLSVDEDGKLVPEQAVERHQE